MAYNELAKPSLVLRTISDCNWKPKIYENERKFDFNGPFPAHKTEVWYRRTAPPKFSLGIACMRQQFSMWPACCIFSASPLKGLLLAAQKWKLREKQLPKERSETLDKVMDLKSLFYPFFYPRSHRAVGMLQSQALWSLKTLFLPLCSYLFSEMISDTPMPWRKEWLCQRILWLFSRSVDCFHNPAVGGRKWCHINYSHSSHWSPLALGVWWSQIFPQTPFVLCPHRSSVTVFIWVSSKCHRLSWLSSSVSRLYLYFRALKFCRHKWAFLKNILREAKSADQLCLHVSILRESSQTPNGPPNWAILYPSEFISREWEITSTVQPSLRDK